jgi:hypothetical protein
MPTLRRHADALVTWLIVLVAPATGHAAPLDVHGRSIETGERGTSPVAGAPVRHRVPAPAEVPWLIGAWQGAVRIPPRMSGDTLADHPAELNVYAAGAEVRWTMTVRIEAVWAFPVDERTASGIVTLDGDVVVLSGRYEIAPAAHRGATVSCTLVRVDDGLRGSGGSTDGFVLSAISFTRRGPPAVPVQ